MSPTVGGRQGLDKGPSADTLAAMTQQPAGPPYAPLPPNHPQAVTALVLGILGVVVCGVIAPFAWNIGNQAVREIDASGGAWGGRTEANAGRILGIVGTALLAVGVLATIVFLVFFVSIGTMSFSTIHSAPQPMGR
jgi:TRAP-type C4-dicarboxylate transport system permease small subunit